MKANEFVKKFGIDEATEIVQGTPSKYMECYYSSVCWDTNTYKYSDRFKPRNSLVNIADLKRLVESHELVAIHGFEKSKEIVANAPSDDHFYSWTLGDSGVRDKTVNIGELRKAIADVESCMEVSSESN